MIYIISGWESWSDQLLSNNLKAIPFRDKGPADICGAFFCWKIWLINFFSYITFEVEFTVSSKRRFIGRFDCADTGTRTSPPTAPWKFRGLLFCVKSLTNKIFDYNGLDVRFPVKGLMLNPFPNKELKIRI